MKKFFIIIAMLMLVSLALRAQNIDYLQKAWEFLANGDCERAEYAYQDYKRGHPKGNAEIEAAIKKCKEGGKSDTKSNAGPTTGTLNGHEWVDLGLPSGTRWATCNVGASTPTAYGNYYAWGETTTKSSYTSDNYTYSDNPTTLPSNRDAATANWGSGWRMPTYDEMYELKSNCTVTWRTQNGVNGRLFTGPNGNTIFLPAAGYRDVSSLYDACSDGYYLSSSLDTGGPDGAWYLYFLSDDYYMSYDSRDYGFTVRPVCVPQPTMKIIYGKYDCFKYMTSGDYVGAKQK